MNRCHGEGLGVCLANGQDPVDRRRGPSKRTVAEFLRCLLLAYVSYMYTTTVGYSTTSVKPFAPSTASSTTFTYHFHLVSNNTTPAFKGFRQPCCGYFQKILRPLSPDSLEVEAHGIRTPSKRRIRYLSCTLHKIPWP